MSNQRLGCLSPLALLTAALTVVVLLAAGIISGSSMFSPGALNAQAGEVLGGVASHAETGTQCAQCHTAPWSGDSMAGRCFICHTDIQQDIGEPATLHGAFLAQNIAYTCHDCHTEHAGPTGELTIFDPVDFPHRATGFELAGHEFVQEGIPFTCTDCHTASLTHFDPQVCTDCHTSLDAAYTAAHRLDFGEDCLACHDGLDRYGDFDHNLTEFALSGAHQEATCAGCHVNARAAADLQNTPAACEACHLDEDAHAGKFGEQCGACHNSADWKDAEFDHNLADFKLEGQHAAVECADCHTAGYAGTPQECVACHQEDDTHAGQYGIDCAGCHNPTDWADASFDHSLSAFPLDGAHTQVACQDCHLNGQFQGTPVECAACHSEPAYHAGMFAGQACSACHSTSAWRPAGYSGPHTFPMDHGEQNNACADCHQPDLTQWTCYTCHDRGEVEEEHRDEGIANFGDCLRCHADGREHDD